MGLQITWFVLVAVLFFGYFVLEGFDFGVGILAPFVSRHDNPEVQEKKRRVVLNTVGPHWDGNEVWLLTGGGALFASFPQWYATLFSGFYLALFLILLALIWRNVSITSHPPMEWPKTVTGFPPEVLASRVRSSARASRE